MISKTPKDFIHGAIVLPIITIDQSNNYSIDLRWTSDNDLGRTRAQLGNRYTGLSERSILSDYISLKFYVKFDVSRSALYGQGTFSLSDLLSLSTGLRLEGMIRSL